MGQEEQLREQLASKPSYSGIRSAKTSSEGEDRERKEDEDYWRCWKAPDSRRLAIDHRSAITAQEF